MATSLRSRPRPGARRSTAGPENVKAPDQRTSSRTSGLTAGDHVWVNCGAYNHHGIATGSERIIHYLGKKGVYADGRIAETGLAAFSDGKPIKVRRHIGRRYDRATSVTRAKERLGESKYNLVFNNCEHFVTWCIEGESESSQVTALTIGAVSVASRPIAYGLAGVFGSLGLLAVRLPISLWSLYKTYKHR